VRLSAVNAMAKSLQGQGQMIKRIILTISLALAVCLIPGVASAHVLKTDGDIGAVLHIEPDDNPLSQTPVTYQLTFNDTSHHFELSQCDCTVTIQNVEGVVKSEQISSKHELDARSTITFPSPDVYTLKVHGQPKKTQSNSQPTDFQTFTLSYTIRVNPGGVHFQAVPLLLWIGIGGAVSLAILAAYKEELDNRTQQKHDIK
jgi:hypothetical protein